MSRAPLAFMSYVRAVDRHEEGRLSALRDRLSGEVLVQTGDEFPIFQDWRDLGWGEPWQERIDSCLDETYSLIPIITPGFFKSSACRAELERFRQREERLGRGDLILPIYYVQCAVIEDASKRRGSPLAEVVAARQYSDWRELRFEPLTSPAVRREIARMAEQIVRALERGA